MTRKANPRLAADSWEAQVRRREAEFCEGWDWEKVVDHWRDRLSRFNVKLNPLFLTVSVYDSGGHDDREPALSWWPTDAIDEMRDRCNAHFVRWPGTLGPVHYDENPRQGCLATLEHLWAVKDEPDKLPALLIAASLFSRIESSRGYYSDENWPPRHCVRILGKWAHDAWGETARGAWHYSCTDVLPGMSEDWIYKIDGMKDLVRYLAEEHASVFLKYKPVVIEYTNKREPALRGV